MKREYSLSLEDACNAISSWLERKGELPGGRDYYMSVAVHITDGKPTGYVFTASDVPLRAGGRVDPEDEQEAT